MYIGVQLYVISKQYQKSKYFFDTYFFDTHSSSDFLLLIFLHKTLNFGKVYTYWKKKRKTND